MQHERLEGSVLPCFDRLSTMCERVEQAYERQAESYHRTDVDTYPEFTLDYTEGLGSQVAEESQTDGEIVLLKPVKRRC